MIKSLWIAERSLRLDGGWLEGSQETLEFPETIGGVVRSWLGISSDEQRFEKAE